MNHWINNAPVRQILQLVDTEVKRLNLIGCEVLGIKLDGFKATIMVSQCDELPAQFDENGFGVIQKEVIKIVWRKSAE